MQGVKGLDLDPKLEKYATKRQWEVLMAWAAEGSSRAAATKLGINQKTVTQCKKAVFHKASRMGYSPDHDMEHTVPEGFRVRGVSTYYGKDGRKRGQWVKSAIDHEQQLAMFQATVEAFADTLPAAPVIDVPEATSDDLMVCYPVGDHHMGLLVWGEEVGKQGEADYDLDISEDMLTLATKYLMDTAPCSNRAALVFLGDFLHYDGMAPVTPTSGNLLDSDTRYPKMVRAAIRVIRFMIEAAAKKHRTVDVIIEIGNHDLSTSIFLMEVLANVYEDNPRVRIDRHPGHYHYLEFGENLVGTHHGHGAKLPELPLIMAVDQPEAWGRCKHRFMWTGHVHHTEVKDVKSVQVESFRVLPPGDAYAHNKGYRSKQDMKAIVLHRKYGEVARFSVNPDIIRDYT
jgi:hypothetical protein